MNSYEIKGKIFNLDIQVIEKSDDYDLAFKIIELENKMYKNKLFENLNIQNKF